MFWQGRGDFTRAIAGLFPQIATFAFADKTLALAVVARDRARRLLVRGRHLRPGDRARHAALAHEGASRSRAGPLHARFRLGARLQHAASLAHHHRLARRFRRLRLWPGFVQQQFFPASNRPELLVTMSLPKNASIAATQAQTERLEKALASDPDISRFSSYVGGGAIRFYLPLDVQLDNDFMAEVVVVAKDLEARDRVQARLETLFANDFPDVTARISRLELGPPVGWPVQYRVSAPTTDEARHYADQVANALRASGLVRNVNYDWAEKSKELRIVVDQDRVRQAGLSSEQLAQALNRVITGTTVTQVRDSIYLIDVVARAESGERSSIEALRNLQITTPTGASVPLRELARFHYELDEGYVWRRGRLPTITVQAEPLPGLEPASVNQRLSGALEALRATMPAGDAPRSRRHGREERAEQRGSPRRRSRS